MRTKSKATYKSFPKEIESMSMSGFQREVKSNAEIRDAKANYTCHVTCSTNYDVFQKLNIDENVNLENAIKNIDLITVDFKESSVYTFHLFKKRLNENDVNHNEDNFWRVIRFLGALSHKTTSELTLSEGIEHIISVMQNSFNDFDILLLIIDFKNDHKARNFGNALITDAANKNILKFLIIEKNATPIKSRKIRNMCGVSEVMKAQLMEYSIYEADNSDFRLNNDPRITKFGKFIRKTSLYELSQIWDIFLGELSVVGPQPSLELEVKKYSLYQKNRLLVKGRLLFLRQIQPNRKKLTFNEWEDLDINYIETRSIGLGLKIICKGAWMVAFDRSGGVNNYD